MAALDTPAPGRERPPPGTPLYVHLPFCVTKCHYCDFFSVPVAGQDVDALLAGILEEARSRAPHQPRTVFLGGGTPSLLSEVQLSFLLDELDALCGFRTSAEEVTAECNPESLTLSKARALLDLGATRLSIGLQSLREEILRRFGRAHSASEGLRAYETARQAGCRNVSVDLIFAAPGLNTEDWRADLAQVLALAPDHLSAYNLTFEEGTLFHAWLQAGRIAREPEELELEQFQVTRELAGEAHLDAYEVSNFASNGHLCSHNVNYWENGAYAGIGPSAASHCAGVRSGNARSLAGYLRGVREHGDPFEWSERLDARARLGETWWLGLRLARGVDPEEARHRAGFRGDDPLLPTARHLCEQGLLAEREGRFALTRSGLPLADAVAREFLE